MSDIKYCALNLLARREHSQFQLRAKLKLRQFDDELIVQVLQQLAEENLQSDVRFTQSYIRMRANKGYGPVRIAAELRERGVTGELIQSHLEISEELWLDKIADVYRKKFGGKAIKDFAEQAKRIRFLQYRGFTREQINSCFKADF